jgi:hypothetical protein
MDKDLKNLNKTAYTIDKSSLKDYDKDWQQILGDEKSRLKKKERDNKQLITRLTGELRRE